MSSPNSDSFIYLHWTTAQGSDLVNPCSELSEVNLKCDGIAGKRFFFDKNEQSCKEANVPDCDDQGGYSSLQACEEECVKTRVARRLPGDSKFAILSDFEISAPKKLSITTRRRFPLQFCELQWDSGLICQGIRRGSYIDQFFYDSKTNSCNHFVYNGCGGNANRFSTIWECIQSCVRKNYGGGRHY